jgi:hypothetical protein
MVVLRINSLLFTRQYYVKIWFHTNVFKDTSIHTFENEYLFVLLICGLIQCSPYVISLDWSP